MVCFRTWRKSLNEFNENTPCGRSCCRAYNWINGRPRLCSRRTNSSWSFTADHGGKARLQGTKTRVEVKAAASPAIRDVRAGTPARARAAAPLTRSSRSHPCGMEHYVEAELTEVVVPVALRTPRNLNLRVKSWSTANEPESSTGTVPVIVTSPLPWKAA